MDSYISGVNQKLLFASLLHKQMVQAGDNRHLKTALGQGAVFHLVQAYRHHLREVAAGYQCPQPPSMELASELLAALGAMDKSPGEAREMQHLEEEAGTWLNSLLASFAGFGVVEAAAGVGPEQEPDQNQKGLIAVRQATARDSLPDLSPAVVAGWLEALRELVERHREVMFEC